MHTYYTLKTIENEYFGFLTDQRGKNEQSTSTDLVFSVWWNVDILIIGCRV